METMEILMALEQCQMTYNLGQYNDAVTAAMELIQQQGELLAAYESGTPTAEQLIEALDNIVWYNGHGEWLLDLADALQNCKKKKSIAGFPSEEWGTEKHTLWMILVGLFGDWGTSVRSGWIEKTKDAAAFIRRICRTYLEERLEVCDETIF